MAKWAILIFFAPLLVYASSAGADAGYSGTNGEQSCAACHTSGSGFGSVQVAFPAGLFYKPGAKQHLVVTITDSSQASWGFQLTARQTSNTNTQAGIFTPGSDGFTQILCADSPLKKQAFQNPCPSNLPLQYIEQTALGTRAGQRRSATFEFDWTPPSTDVGPIILNIGSVAADGDGSPYGDHVYNQRYTLTVAQPNQPIISAGGVANGASYANSVAPGAWVTVTGTQLANTTRTWRSEELAGGKLPTQLDGVSATIDGKPAYPAYISPGQVNLVAPANTALGSVNVVITNNGLVSNTSTITMQTAAPGLFASGKYAIATDASYALKTASKPGDVITLWAAGLGPTTPNAPAGQLTPADQLYSVTNPLTVLIGNIGSQVIGAALSPGFAALYQISVVVPDGLDSGDKQIILQSGSAQSPTGVYLNVQR